MKKNCFAIWLIAVIFTTGGCDDECTCTMMDCPPGVYVEVVQSNGAPFKSADWQLNWKTKNNSGTEALPGPMPALQTIDMLIYNIESVTEENAWIQLSLVADGETVATQLFRNLQWETRTCNHCTGGCEDLVTNANISFEIPAIEQDTAAQ